jgi:hypothetical protein
MLNSACAQNKMMLLQSNKLNPGNLNLYLQAVQDIPQEMVKGHCWLYCMVIPKVPKQLPYNRVGINWLPKIIFMYCIHNKKY